METTKKVKKIAVESRFLTCPQITEVKKGTEITTTVAPRNTVKVKEDKYGGAHEYSIENFVGRDGQGNWIPTCRYIDDGKGGKKFTSSYQTLRFAEIGSTGAYSKGITHTQVVDVLIDSIRKLNGGLASPDNDMAVAHLMKARSYIEKRTADRVARGVIGKEAL